jgi:hypothetical protein
LLMAAALRIFLDCAQAQAHTACRRSCHRIADPRPALACRRVAIACKRVVHIRNALEPAAMHTRFKPVWCAGAE